MVLLWKCKFGVYYTNPSIPAPDPSQIVWKDEESLWGFGTTFNEPTVMYTNPRYTGGTSGYESYVYRRPDQNINCANMLESVLGDDYYQVYTPPNSYYFVSNYNAYNAILPSYVLPYPNYVKEMLANNNRYNQDLYAIYINSLGVYITSSAVYRYVNGVKQILYNGLTLPFLLDNDLRYFSIVNYDGTLESIANVENLRTTTVGFGQNTDLQFAKYTKDGISGSWASGFEGFIRSVFANGFVEPDGNKPSNPYEGGGTSLPGDLPPGTFDDTSDPIPDSPLPTISAANTGFTRIYNPTLAQVQALARYLWTEESVVETIWNHIKQYFEDPMQAIIGFNLVPCPVPDGGMQEFALMYIGTGVQMTVAANQFVDVDCGTYTLERYYGSALDQSPFTKVSCFLPYIGMVQLSTDEVMGTELHIKYRIDIVTGSCVAKIFVDGSCLYQYSGHCAINIPISSADFSSYVSAAISIAKLAATAGIAALSGGGEGAEVAEAAQQTGRTVTTQIDTVNTVRNPNTGRQITDSATHQTVTATYSPPPSQTTTEASMNGMSPQNISNTVGAVMSAKPVINHSGSFSGNSGYLGVRRPFLIIERPNMCLPANYQALNGYPAMITMELGECKGYTRVQQVQLTGLWATNPEQAEILQLLKGGVVF